MAHTPLKMSIAAVHDEVQYAWTNSYSPDTTAAALAKIANAPAPYKISHLIARLCFRGIYFPQRSKWAWLKVLKENRAVILQIVRECFTRWRGSADAEVHMEFDAGLRRPRATEPVSPSGS
jgi:hypothetical protein